MKCKDDPECNSGEVCVGGVCKKINDSYGLSKFYSGANNMMGGRADMQDLEFDRMNEDGFPIMKSKKGGYSIQFVLIDFSKGANKE